MTMRRLYTLLHTLIPTAAILAAFVACSSDDVTDAGTHRPDKGVRIDLQIGTTPQEQNSSRATWSDQMARDGEMIKTCYVVMTKEEAVETVVEIFRITEPTEFESHLVGSIADATTGTYKFYSFANFPAADISYTASGENATLALLTPVKLDEATPSGGWQFIKGSALTFDPTQLCYPAQYNHFPVASSTTGIPMTNIETYEVSKDVTIRLTLYRMLTKIRFDLTNTTGKELKLKTIKLGNVTPNHTVEKPSYLTFLPQRDANGGQLTTFPLPAGTAKRSTETLETNVSGEAGSTLADKASFTRRVYFNESVSDHASGQFPLELQYSFTSPSEEVTRNALIKLSSLPRNNAAIVPIKITNYDVKLETFFYPPIGGYPGFREENNTAEKYYAVIFEGGGDFVMRPYVYAYADRHSPEKWYELTNTTLIKNYGLTVEDPDGIFTTKPHFDPVTGEILGSLDPIQTGTATVQLGVTIILTADPEVTQVFNRTLYIVKQN